MWAAQTCPTHTHEVPCGLGVCSSSQNQTLFCKQGAGPAEIFQTLRKVPPGPEPGRGQAGRGAQTQPPEGAGMPTGRPGSHMPHTPQTAAPGWLTRQTASGKSTHIISLFTLPRPSRLVNRRQQPRTLSPKAGGSPGGVGRPQSLARRQPEQQRLAPREAAVSQAGFPVPSFLWGSVWG